MVDSIDTAAFVRDGYTVAPDLLGHDDLSALRDASVALCRGWLGAIKGLVESPAGENDARPASVARFSLPCVKPACN